MSSLQRGNAESLVVISFPTHPCLSFFDVFALRVRAIHWWENSCTKRPLLCTAATDATSQYTSAAFDGRILAVSLFVHNADLCRPNGPNQLSLRPWALYTLQVHVLTVCYQSPNFTRSLYVNQRPKSPLSFPFPSSLKVGVWIWNWGGAEVLRWHWQKNCWWVGQLSTSPNMWPFGSSLRKSEVHMCRAIC